MSIKAKQIFMIASAVVIFFLSIYLEIFLKMDITLIHLLCAILFFVGLFFILNNKKNKYSGEEHYRSLYNTMLNGYALHEMIFDKDGVAVDYRFLDVNPAFEEMTGLKKDKCIGKTIKEIMPNTEYYWIEIYGKVVSTGKSIRYENYAAEIGKYFEVNAFFIGKNQFGVLVVDVSERRSAEEALKVALNFNEEIINNVNEGIVVYDNKLRYTVWNSFMERLTGKTAGEVFGEKLIDIFPGLQGTGLIQNAEKALMGETVVTNDFKFKDGNGNYKWISVTSSPNYNGNREIIGVINTIVDVTSKVEYNKNLEKMVEFADELLQVSTEKIDYERLLNNIIQLSKAKFATLNIYHNDGSGRFETVAYAGIKNAIKNATKFLGFQLYGKVWERDVNKEENIKDNITTHFLGLSELVGKAIPEPAVKMIEEIFKVGEVVIVKILRDEQIIGDFTLLLPKGVAYSNEDLIEIYSKQIGMFITRKRVEDALKESQAILEAAFENSQAGIAIANAPNGRLRYVNKAGLLIRNKSEEELVHHIDADKYVGSWNILHHDGTPYKADEVPLTRAVLYGETSSKEFIIRRDNFEDRIVLANAAPINDEKGKTIAGVVVFLDITERKKQEEEIVYLGYHDSLTGLYNRAFFEEEVRRLDVDRQMPLSVIMGDINGLKLINDSFGHELGDKLIVEIAKIIKGACREEDIVARFGGDEFCILLPKSNEVITQNICNRIYKKCEEQEKSSSEVPFISISLGYTTRTSAYEPIDAIMRDAEAAMYKHKLLETRSLRSSIVSSIISTLRERYIETEEHSDRMKRLCRATGIALGITDSKLDDLELLALLHDIGKIAISDSLINKTSSLSDEEWEEMKRHTEIGYHITQSTIEFQQISEYILTHHEKWDGSGYPRQLKGEEIPLLSRIISVIDAFDAMVNDRPYRKALTEDAAIVELGANAGTQFDPEIVDVFIHKVLKN